MKVIAQSKTGSFNANSSTTMNHYTLDGGKIFSMHGNAALIREKVEQCASPKDLLDWAKSIGADEATLV